MAKLPNSRLRAGPFPLKRILVLSDLSDAAENAAWRAGLLAQEHGAWLRIVHVRAWPGPSAQAQRLLDALAWRLQEHLRIPVVTQSFQGYRRREIAVAAREADLLVTGAMRNGLNREWVAGMHPDRLVRLGGLPTLVVRRPASLPYQRVIAGVPQGPDSFACIAAASGMAGGPHVQLAGALGEGSGHLPRELAVPEGRMGGVEARIHALAQATPGVRMKEAPCLMFAASVDTLLETEQVLFPELVVVTHAPGELPSWLAPSLPRHLLAHTRVDTLIVPAAAPEPASSARSREARARSPHLPAAALGVR